MQIYDPPGQEPSDGGVQSLIHELKVHQIELEMQSEELRTTQEETEEARNRYVDLYDFSPVSYFTFDNNRLILKINPAGVPDSKNTFYQHIRQVFGIETRQIHGLKLVDKNRNQFDARLESLAVQDSEGKLCRVEQQ